MQLPCSKSGCRLLTSYVGALKVIGSFSIASAQTQFCYGDLRFIRPDSSGKTWTEAQQRCKDNNSTLPIADNADHQTSFVNALSHFNLTGLDVWLGASASDNSPDNWRWLDASKYTGTGKQTKYKLHKVILISDWVKFFTSTIMIFLDL